MTADMLTAIRADLDAGKLRRAITTLLACPDLYTVRAAAKALAALAQAETAEMARDDITGDMREVWDGQITAWTHDADYAARRAYSDALTYVKRSAA